MSYDDLIEMIKRMIQDRNFYINSAKGTEKQIYAWKYSRADLEIILKAIESLE